MIITTEENKTVIACSHYGKEYAVAFNQDADADDMIIQVYNLLRFMGYAEETIDYIMGVEK